MASLLPVLNYLWNSRKVAGHSNNINAEFGDLRLRKIGCKISSLVALCLLRSAEFNPLTMRMKITI